MENGMEKVVEAEVSDMTSDDMGYGKDLYLKIGRYVSGSGMWFGSIIWDTKEKALVDETNYVEWFIVKITTPAREQMNPEAQDNQINTS